MEFTQQVQTHNHKIYRPSMLLKNDNYKVVYSSVAASKCGEYKIPILHNLNKVNLLQKY